MHASEQGMLRERDVTAAAFARLPEEPVRTSSHADQVAGLFERHFARVYRVLNRLSGDSDLAADLAQEAFLRLNRRGTLPDVPEAWLITVALNLFRNARSTRARRLRLLTRSRAEAVLADPSPVPGFTISEETTRQRVRAALDQLPRRERQLLLLHAEGYRYREIAAALGLTETSVGTLLARARAAFRQACEGCDDAP